MSHSKKARSGVYQGSSLPLRLPAAASALALVLAFSGAPTYAADSSDDSSTAKPAKKSELEEVVVTGLRESLKSAQAIKQNAEQVVDSVTAQDIGALPDRSVSEALQRIPGVTLQRTNENRDPARLAAEGGGVFIRGLSWVRSELNGRDIFSANNGRGLSFEDVSSDLLAGVDVYKNPSADMVEGGIGGIVNLRTRLPLDQDKRLIAFSVDDNYADLLKDSFVSGNALFSDNWEAGDGRIGFLASYSVGNIGNRTDSIQTGRFEPHTLGAPQDGQPKDATVYIPNSFGWRRIDWQQKRTAAMAAFQWQPSDSLTFTLQGMQARARPRDIEHALGDTDGGYAVDDTSYQFNSQGVITGGTIKNFKPTADTRFGDSDKRTSDYSFNAKFTINDRWAGSYDLQYVKSTANVISMTAFTQNGSQPLGSLDFDLTGDTPKMHLNNPDQATASAYWWAAAMDHLEKNEADSWAQRFDVEYTFDDTNPWLKSFRLGVRSTDRTSLTRQTGYNWSLLSNQFWGNGGGSVVHITDPAAPNTSAATQYIDYNNFFRGNVGLPGTAWFPAASLVSHSRDGAYNLLRGTETSGWGWVPLTDASFDNAHPAGDNAVGGTNDQTETTRAVYAVLRFGHDAGFLGPMDGNIGARLVRTETNATGQALTVSALQGTPAGCTAEFNRVTQANIDDPNAHLPLPDCTTFNAAYAFTQGAVGGSLSGVNNSHTYTDVLPSLNLRFHLTPELQWRLAASKAIVRPTFAQMVSYTSLSFTFNNTYYPAAVTASASGGNPNLKPTKANQYDTSLEWYFAPTGSLTGGLFYKDIKDYIFIGNHLESYTAGGQTLQFLTSRNANGSKGKIQGFELEYTQFYDFLPGILSGIGLQANYTYVDSSGGKNTAVNVLEPAQVTGAQDPTLPLEGLSKNSYNVALMYEKYNLSARLAYNWRERYLLTTSAANIQRPVWSENYGQLDASAFYSVTTNIKVGVQATNVLNTRTFLDVGGTSLAPRYSWTDTDRRIALALRATF